MSKRYIGYSEPGSQQRPRYAITREDLELMESQEELIASGRTAHNRNAADRARRMAAVVGRPVTAADRHGAARIAKAREGRVLGKKKSRGLPRKSVATVKERLRLNERVRRALARHAARMARQ